jgi:hypothetical protein
MNDREKALEAALRDALRYFPTGTVRCRGDKCRDPWCESCYGEDAAEAWLTKAQSEFAKVRAALAMPATVDRWEAGRDVQHIVDAVWAEYADSVKDRWTFRKEHIENAIKRAIAIRNLTPPEDRG